MRLEVRTIKKNEQAISHKFGGIRKEDIGVFDADTGDMIGGIQEMRLVFNCKETARLELDVLWKRDSVKNEFDFDEAGLYDDKAPAGSRLLRHNLSRKFLIGVSSVDLKDELGIMTIVVIDFDTNLNILRPFKKAE